MMLERKWWTLIAVCVAIFMLLLDITIVNVALPDIARSLHASFTDLQWVVDAYALTLATCVLNAGSLADLLGRKRVFVAGVAPVRPRDLAGLPDPRTRPPGRGRRDHVRDLARAAHAGVPRPRARHRVRPLGRDHGRRRRRRPARRRGADRGRLALDLPRE